MGINNSDYQKKQIRTLVLSTNVNDYDTGEPIVDGSISKTLSSDGDQIADSPIPAKLHGLIVGRKYYTVFTLCSQYKSEGIKQFQLKPVITYTYSLRT
jgi:hypothetical protein